jgi:DNA-directed RNA polymerase subunit RPC12/RpoP
MSKGANVLFCHNEDFVKQHPEKIVDDCIGGHSCTNCGSPVLISEAKLKYIQPDSTFLCLYCGKLLLMDSEYIKQMNFLDANDPENNELGKRANEVFGGDE